MSDNAQPSIPSTSGDDAPTNLTGDSPSARIGVRCDWIEQPIAKSLVVPLYVVMINVSSDRTPKVLFAQRNDAGQTLRPEAQNPSLRVGIQIGTSVLEHRAKCFRLGRVTIEDQVLRLFQETIHAVGQVSSKLLCPGFTRRSGDTRDVDATRTGGQENQCDGSRVLLGSAHGSREAENDKALLCPQVC
ncbi:MAG TPA: hypothetical protein VIV60_20530 [Polyangiaceae bacterium]